MNIDNMWTIYDVCILEEAARGRMSWDRVEPLCYATSKEQIERVAEDIEARRPEIIIGKPGEASKDVALRAFTSDK